MTARQKVFVALAACHLGLVIYNGFRPALELPAPSVTHPAGLAVNTYGVMSGAGNTYGFFKFIGGTCRVRFQLADADGNFWSDVLSRADNPEAEIRYRLTGFQLSDYGEILPANWAATMFARHPKAVQVIVTQETYQPPSMAEYREGKRAEWTETYQQLYWRHDQLFAPKKDAQP